MPSQTPTQIVAQTVEVMAESATSNVTEMPVVSHASAETVEVVETSETRVIESVETEVAAVSVVEEVAPAVTETIQAATQESAAVSELTPVENTSGIGGFGRLAQSSGLANGTNRCVGGTVCGRTGCAGASAPPRERKPRVVVEEEPLQLVETVAKLIKRAFSVI